MVDFSAPTFSLDLDLEPDLSTEEEREDDARDRRGGTREGTSPLLGAAPSGSRRWVEEEEEDELDGNFAWGAVEEGPPEGTLALKRLKRGLLPPRQAEITPQRTAVDPSMPNGAAEFSALDDDIEEFSSQEDHGSRDEYCSRQNYSACSSSKFSLHCQKILTTLSARKLKTPKNKENFSIPTSVEASSNKNVLPRLTASPLRRIRLLDSDSDDISIGRDRRKDAKDVDTYPKTNGFVPAQCLSGARQRKTEISSSKCPSESLWKDFSRKKKFNFAMPALDDFCEEHFKAAKSPIVSEWTKQHTAVANLGIPLPNDFVDEVECPRQKNCITNSAEHDWNHPDPVPPSYQYFYHADVRVQNLVRQRLTNFIPLGDMKCIGSQQPNAKTFDYMSQFGPRKVPCRVYGANQGSLEVGSEVRARIQKNANGKEVAETAGTRVNPGSGRAIPKDAGKRRVQADGHSLGHWYTGQNGIKVYVTKNGQELSGQVAYIQYIKESGAQFRKSRKKAPGASKRKRKQ